MNTETATVELTLTPARIVEALDKARGRGRERTLDTNDVRDAIAMADDVKPGTIVRARHRVANSYSYAASSDVVEIVADGEGGGRVYAGRGRAGTGAYGKGSLVTVAQKRTLPESCFVGVL